MEGSPGAPLPVGQARLSRVDVDGARAPPQAALSVAKPGRPIPGSSPGDVAPALGPRTSDRIPTCCFGLCSQLNGMSQGSLGYRGKRAAGEGAPGAGPEARVRVAGSGAPPRAAGEEFGVSCRALGAWLGLGAGFSSCRGHRPRLLPWAVILSLSRGCSQRLCSDALRHHTHLGRVWAAGLSLAAGASPLLPPDLHSSIKSS